MTDANICLFLKETDATAVPFYNMEEGSLSHNFPFLVKGETWQ